MTPSPLSVYFVGVGLLAVFGAVASVVLRAPEGTQTRLTTAAKDCGFADPRFTRRGESWLINETLVTRQPDPSVPPEDQERGRRQIERSRLLQTRLMPCLQQAAKSIGARIDYEKRVGYEKTVMTN